MDRFVDAPDSLLLRIFRFMEPADSHIAAEISDQLPFMSASAPLRRLMRLPLEAKSSE